MVFLLKLGNALAKIKPWLNLKKTELSIVLKWQRNHGRWYLVHMHHPLTPLRVLCTPLLCLHQCHDQQLLCIHMTKTAAMRQWLSQSSDLWLKVVPLTVWQSIDQKETHM